MIKKVTQIDTALLKLANMTKTPEGYLVGMVPIAKIGIYKYLQEDGTVQRQFVNKDTLINKKSLDTLKLKPITNQHPPEILLDSTNVKKRQVGSTGENAVLDGEFLLTSLTITDAEAIQATINGTNGLSPGYVCDLEMTSGTYNGEPYDCIQINRDYNHVCICDIPRGGDDIRLPQLDGITFIEKNNTDKLTKGYNMAKLNIEGIEYEVPPEVLNYVGKLQAGSKAMEDQCKTVSGTMDALKAKLDSFEKRDINAEIQKGILERSALLSIAKDKAKLDSKTCPNIDTMTPQEIKMAIIKKVLPNAQLDSQEQSYINGFYNAVIGTQNFDASAIDDQRQQSSLKMDGSIIDIVEKARLDSEDRIKNAYLNLGKKA